MSTKLVAIFSATAGLLLASAPSSGHHGSNIVYDLTQSITVTGTVTDFRFVNPHTLIFFDVTSEDGPVVGWLAGLSSPNSLAPNDDWTRDTLQPGDEISITGAPGRRGAPTIWVEQIFLNGKALLGQRYTG